MLEFYVPTSLFQISNVDATEKQDKNQAKKQNTLTELDITKEFIPKFQVLNYILLYRLTNLFISFSLDLIPSFDALQNQF